MMRVRSSETVKMFFRLSITIALDGLGRSAGGQNLLGRPAAELVRANGQRFADLAAREDLHPGVGARHQPALAQQVRRHHHAGAKERAERIEVDDLVLHAKRVVEAALGHAPVQRHLAALETALALEARARLRALVSAPGRLPLAGSLAASHSLL